MTNTKKATVATPSAAYSRMLPRWQMIDALLGGTEAMRTAGRDYLPQHDKETNRNYEVRLTRSTLLNATEQTLDTLAGKPFREQIVLGDDVPKQIVDMAEDVDLQGSNLQAFCRTWFREGWAKGLAHVLVENPTAPPPAEGEVRTLADDRAEGLRPYWVHVRPEALIAAYSTVEYGQEVLTHVRIVERTVERVGWEEVEVTRVRVIEPGHWWLYAPDDKGDEWHLEEEGDYALGYIALVTFYAGKRCGLMECKPPLMDLAYLNVEHWQSSSDQRNVLTVARFPILAASGVPAEAKVDIGPNNFLSTESTDGKWYYVEHTGAAIGAGQTDLDALEQRMASYGAEYMRKRPGNETATARALDSAESSSYLASTVHDFGDCVEQAMAITADWLRLDSGGSVQISADVDISETDATELDALLKMRAQKDLSRVTLVSEMQRRGVLADDFDGEEDAELLAEEAETSMGDMFGNGGGMQPPGGGTMPGDGNRPPIEDDPTQGDPNGGE